MRWYLLTTMLAVGLGCSTLSAQVILEVPMGKDKMESKGKAKVVKPTAMEKTGESNETESGARPKKEMKVVPSTIASNNGVPVLGTDVLRGQPIKMFENDSLEGWTLLNGKPSKNWIVKDGVLHRAKRAGHLYHQDWYQDFDMTFEFKILAKGNSGVKYRVKKYGEKPIDMLGCEFQLQDDKGQPFKRTSTGGLYAVYEPSANKTEIKLDDWNTARIIVCGYRVQHWLNGQLVVNATFGDSEWHRRVGESKFSQREGFGLNRDGQIFLQDHGHPVWFRGMTITPLDSSQPKFVPSPSLFQIPQPNVQFLPVQTLPAQTPVNSSSK